MKIPLLVSLAGFLLVSPLPAQPNLLLILADDLGARDLGCYGSEFHETPHLDRLAREGMRFTRAYSAGSVCSPTRGSLMTGQYPARTGITDYIPGVKDQDRKLATRPTRMELALEHITVAEALKEGGYQTVYGGKWHLGGEGFGPEAQGFEVVVNDAELGDRSKDWQVGQRLAESAVRFLDERDTARPFFMMLGFHEPHTPIIEVPDQVGKFREKAAKLPAPVSLTRQERDGQTRIVQNDPAYASEVAGLDAFVGSILAKLEAKGLARDTVVMFTSDNGGLSTKATPGPTSNEPLRAGKGWLYEGGIRVPFIVRAPGLVKAGAVSDASVVTPDFYPTLLDLAGLPARAAQHCDGLSIVPVLRGTGTPARGALFWHYPHYHGSTWSPGGAMLEGDWKLIEFFEDGAAELYELKSDPSERKNLAAAEPARLAAMREKLAAWRREAGAVVPHPGTASTAKARKKVQNRG